MKTHSPENAGMSSKRLARISNVMEQFVEGNQLPGIMTLVQRKGQVVHLGQYGMIDYRGQQTDAGRCAVPHILDDQAHCERGLDDVAGRRSPQSQ